MHSKPGLRYTLYIVLARTIGPGPQPQVPLKTRLLDMHSHMAAIIARHGDIDHDHDQLILQEM